MNSDQQHILTQSQLVEELRSRGYSDASETRVALWRKLELLPAFDGGGHGRGRGCGREECFWTSQDVVERAVAVSDLLKTYNHLEELYLPLWQMGFEIPIDRVRPALMAPLLKAAEDFGLHEDSSAAIEDLIDEQVAKISPVIKRKIPFFDVPEESLAVVVNVIANPKYAFWDEPYEDGVTKLREWELSFAQRCREHLGSSLEVNRDVVANSNDIFKDAPLINRYLSLPNLLTVTGNCTNEELQAVQRDLQVGREILLVFKRIVELLSPFLPESWRLQPEKMKVVFNFGRIMVWVDLALRRHGFGPLIDQALSQILNQLLKDFDEAAERKLQAAGPEISKTLVSVQTMFTEMAGCKDERNSYASTV